MTRPGGDGGSAGGRFLRSPWPAVMLGALCFASSIGNGFAYDDCALVLDNPRIRTLTDFRAVWLSDWWQLVEHAAEVNPQRDRLYRPLSMFTFALNYAVHAYRPAGYHVVNLLLHAAACLLVWLLARRLVPEPAVAAWAAVLFAVHPIHVEAVAGVVGRAELLATVLLLGGLLVLLPRDGAAGLGRAVLAIPLFLLALLAKETAVCYPAVALLALYMTQHATPRRWRWWALHGVCLLVPLLAYLPLRYVALEHQLFRVRPVDVLMNPLVTAGGLERAWGVLTVLGHYAILMVVPAQLSCDYGIAIVDPRHGFTLVTLVGLLAVAGLCAALVGLLRRGARWRQVALLAAIGLASYALISNTVLLIGVAVAERLFYWPSVPLLVLAGVGIVEFWRRQRAAGPAGASATRLLPALGVLLVLSLGLRTALRNLDWASNLTLFTQDFATHPDGAHLNKGCALELMNLWRDLQTPRDDLPGRWDVARRHLISIGLWHDEWPPERKLEEFLRAASWHANRAVEIYPGYAEALALRGRIRAQLGEVDKALLDVEAALELDPALEGARQTLGQLLYGSDADRRLVNLQKRATENPDDPAARRELGLALLEYGHYAAAQKQLERAVALTPDDVAALRGLAEVLTLRQENERAIQLFEKVLTLAPDDWQAHANLVTLLAGNDPRAALQHAERAYALKPGEPRNSINLAEAYALNGRKAEAIALLARVERQLDSDDPLRRVVNERLAVLRQR
jgi:protein O-mannosyl-transferase